MNVIHIIKHIHQNKKEVKKVNSLILNGFKNDSIFYNKIKNKLLKILSEKNIKNNWIDLVEKDIEYCNGCGYCNMQNPGICAKNDDMKEIFPLMANSEVLIFISPIKFGCYNSQLKKAIDRYSVMGLPTYSVHKGELHHPARYNNPNYFMSIGILDQPNKDIEDTFKLVSDRNAICFFTEESRTLILNDSIKDSEIKNKITEGIKNLGVK